MQTNQNNIFVLGSYLDLNKWFNLILDEKHLQLQIYI